MFQIALAVTLIGIVMAPFYLPSPFNFGFAVCALIVTITLARDLRRDGR